MKYTPALALSIKRDVEQAQKLLATILSDIEEKRKEIRSIDSVLTEKRNVLSSFEDSMVGVFSRRENEIKEKQELLSEKEDELKQLNANISTLEIARDLLSAELQFSGENKGTDGTVLVQSLVENLQQTLDKLLTDIDYSESRLKTLKEGEQKLVKATKTLIKESTEQKTKIQNAKDKLNEIEKQRTLAIAEIAKENETLRIIKQREKDSRVMEKRLNSEYQRVFNSLPRRNQ